MSRSPLLLTATASTLAVWLVSASACGGGGSGGGPVASDDGDERPASSDPAVSSSGDTSEPSPFEPEASAGTSGGVPGDGVDDGPESGTEDGTAMVAEPSSDNGPELQRPTGEGDETGAIAGLWDYSRVTAAGADTVFVEIDAVGNVTEYDFQADAVGNGENCHLVQRSSIASRGEERYDIGDSSTLPGSRSVDDVLITADAGEIRFRYFGESTDPQFNGQLVGVSESYPAVAGRDADSFAICGEDG